MKSGKKIYIPHIMSESGVKKYVQTKGHLYLGTSGCRKLINSELQKLVLLNLVYNSWNRFEHWSESLVWTLRCHMWYYTT